MGGEGDHYCTGIKELTVPKFPMMVFLINKKSFRARTITEFCNCLRANSPPPPGS